MSKRVTRRKTLGKLGAALAGLMALPAVRAAMAAVQKGLAAGDAPRGYDPAAHRWIMGVDANR